MIVKLLIGPDAGQTTRVRDDIGLRMIADGRAEDPFSDAVRNRPVVETQTRKPDVEKAVRLVKPARPFTFSQLADSLFGRKPTSTK